MPDLAELQLLGDDELVGWLAFAHLQAPARTAVAQAMAEALALSVTEQATMCPPLGPAPRQLAPSASDPSGVNELTKWADLWKMGAISEEEHLRKKTELLG